jgi:pimeloyl-ACP methyl ester carboxylesterase
LYSYVNYLTAAGYAVLDIDRLGVGLSDHPTPEDVTILSGAYTIHQIVQDLRSGSLTGVKFKKVMLVGHSMGSAISMVEAGSYHDVDALILSGFAGMPFNGADPASIKNFESDVFYRCTQSKCVCSGKLGP